MEMTPPLLNDVQKNCRVSDGWHPLDLSSRHLTSLRRARLAGLDLPVSLVTLQLEPLLVSSPEEASFDANIPTPQCAAAGADLLSMAVQLPQGLSATLLTVQDYDY